MTDKARDKIRNLIRSHGQQQPDSWLCIVLNRTRPTIDAMYQDIEAGNFNSKRSWMIDQLIVATNRLTRMTKKNPILAILKRAGWKGE